MATLKQMSEAVETFLADGARGWSEPLIVSRQWAPEFERKNTFKPADSARLTVIPGGLSTMRTDADDWHDTPVVGVMLQARFEGDADGDRLSDLVEEIVAALVNIDLTAVACELDRLDVAEWADREDLRRRVWTTGILMVLAHPMA